MSVNSCDRASLKSPEVKDEAIDIPTKWRDDTMECIKNKKLTPNARKEIVQTLVTLIISKFGSNPVKSQLEATARRLILKYPFMRDDIGTGYVSGMNHGNDCLKHSASCLLISSYMQASWVDKMVERKRNLKKMLRSGRLLLRKNKDHLKEAVYFDFQVSCKDS